MGSGLELMLFCNLLGWKLLMGITGGGELR